MPNPVVVVAPGQLLTIREAKDHLRIAQNDLTEDARLGTALKAAVTVAENETARKFVTQALDLTIDDFPGGDWISLAGGVLQSITSLTYTDSADAATVWGAANYFASTTHEPGRLHLAYGISWPSVTLRPADAVVIRYVAGYGTGDQVPEDIRAAVLLILGDLWENREDSVIGQGLTPVSIPRGAANLLAPYRIYYL